MNVLSRDCYQCYLAAKKGVDDRALNRRVWGHLKKELFKNCHYKPPNILELGGGIGTMIERLLDSGLLVRADYHLLDISRAYLNQSRRRLKIWAEHKGLSVTEENFSGFKMKGKEICIGITFHEIDVYKFLNIRTDMLWDLIIAHAFMDLVDTPQVTASLQYLLKPGGLMYFSLNYDGQSIFLPRLKRSGERKILELYHDSMGRVIIENKLLPKSQTATNLFYSIRWLGLDIIASGRSDWKVWPQEQGYLDMDAFFLHFILETINHELNKDPRMNQQILMDWIKCRHQQVKESKLLFLAKNQDILIKNSLV